MIEVTDKKLSGPMPDGTINIPKPAGYWIISGSFHIPVKRRPSRWNRFWVKLLLGWEWREATK